MITEIIIAGTMSVAVLGMVYALRKQGNNFQVLDTANLQQRVSQLETANRYLLLQIEEEREHNRLEIETIRRENKAEIDALKNHNKLLGDLLSDIQQEARNLKEQREGYLAELNGLRQALRQQ